MYGSAAVNILYALRHNRKSLPVRVSEQGNVIGLVSVYICVCCVCVCVCVCTKQIVLYSSELGIYFNSSCSDGLLLENK